VHACKVLPSCLAEARFEKVCLHPHSQKWGFVSPEMMLHSVAQDTLRESEPLSLRGWQP